jgi:hypothetical protein
VAVVLLTRRFRVRKVALVLPVKVIKAGRGLTTQTAEGVRTSPVAVAVAVRAKQASMLLTEAAVEAEGGTVLPVPLPERLLIMPVVAVEVRGKTATRIPEPEV